MLYQAVYQQLYRVFDKTFIHDSYASRESKGTHAGVRRFAVFARKVSANHTKPAFVLKCDVRKFFDGIDHALLLSLISKKITDEKLFELVQTIVRSFEMMHGKGLPLGNVTSQLFANIYLNEFDQFVKHTLKAKFYIRYCDDFVILDENRAVLFQHVGAIRNFLRKSLFLELHPNKVSIRALRQGTDFLGYVSLPHHRVLRTKTKQRRLKKLTLLSKSIASEEDFEPVRPVIESYLGIVSHCKGEQLKRTIKTMFEKWL